MSFWHRSFAYLLLDWFRRAFDILTMHEWNFSIFLLKIYWSIGIDTDSLPKWPEINARSEVSQEQLLLGCRGPQPWSISHCFPKELSREWVRSGVAETWYDFHHRRKNAGSNSTWFATRLTPQLLSHGTDKENSFA